MEQTPPRLSANTSRIRLDRSSADKNESAATILPSGTEPLPHEHRDEHFAHAGVEGKTSTGFDAAIAERLLDLIEKAERRGQFTVPEAELLAQVGKEFGIPLNLIESLATRLVDTGQIGRSSTHRGTVLHRDLSSSERKRSFGPTLCGAY